MKKINLTQRLRYLFCCFILHNSSVFAFSSSPQDDKNYSPAVWASSVSAENDAIHAVKNNDFRLLGFAGRGGNIPGVENTQKQTYIENCGIRYFDEFGDLIRERKQLDLREKARQYATEYNRIILMKCSLKAVEK